MANPGQTIRIVGNQRLSGTLYVTKSVRLVGTPNANGSRPTIYGRIVVSDGDLGLEYIRIEANELGPVLEATGGSATLTDTEVTLSTALQILPAPAVEVAAVYVNGGYVRIIRGSIGPGYSQAIAVKGGTLDVFGASIAGGGNNAVFIRGGSATISQSQISGLRGVFVTGSPYLSIDSSIFNVRTNLFVVTLRDNPRGSLTNNRFVGGGNSNWLCLRPTVTLMKLIGNARSDGAELTAPIRRDSC